MWLILVIAFAILVAVGYGVGIRQGQAWGKVAVTVAVLGLLFMLADKGFFHLIASRRGRPGLASAVRMSPGNRLRLLGQGLKGLVPPDATIFLVTDVSPEIAERRLPAYLEDLAAGFGSKDITAAGFYGPLFGAGTYADLLSSELSAYQGKLDAIVFLSGLPSDLERLEAYQWANPPKVVGVVLPGSGPGNLEMSKVREWMEGGFLQAVVVFAPEQGGIELYTKENFPRQ